MQQRFECCLCRGPLFCVGIQARALAKVLAEGPPLVFAAIKEVARESEKLSFGEAMRCVMSRGFPTVDRLYGSEDQREGAVAFTEKRAPVWKGH